MLVMDILTFIFGFVLSCAIYAGVPQCYWHKFLLYWWLGKIKIQRLHNGFKNKHIDSLNNDLIKGNLPRGKNPKSLTKQQKEDLDVYFAKYYKKLPGTITIFSRRPLFDEYKHFFSNCYYTENDVTFYDYKPKERTIVKRKQRLFVGFARLEGEPLEVHVFDQNCYWWLLTFYTGFMSFLFMLINFTWFCIQSLPVICSLSISFLSFSYKLISLPVNAGKYLFRFLISRAG